MLRIDLEEQAIVDRKRGAGLRASSGELQNRVCAIGVRVDPVRSYRKRANVAGRSYLQAFQRVRRNLGVLGADFTPGDFAVTVCVERERVVEIAQRDVKLSRQRDAVTVERQIRVARLVRER